MGDISSNAVRLTLVDSSGVALDSSNGIITAETPTVFMDIASGNLVNSLQLSDFSFSPSITISNLQIASPSSAKVQFTTPSATINDRKIGPFTVAIPAGLSVEVNLVRTSGPLAGQRIGAVTAVDTIAFVDLPGSFPLLNPDFFSGQPINWNNIQGPWSIIAPSDSNLEYMQTELINTLESIVAVTPATSPMSFQGTLNWQIARGGQRDGPNTRSVKYGGIYYFAFFDNIINGGSGYAVGDIIAGTNNYGQVAVLRVKSISSEASGTAQTLQSNTVSWFNVSDLPAGTIEITLSDDNGTIANQSTTSDSSTTLSVKVTPGLEGTDIKLVSNVEENSFKRIGGASIFGPTNVTNDVDQNGKHFTEFTFTCQTAALTSYSVQILEGALQFDIPAESIQVDGTASNKVEWTTVPKTVDAPAVQLSLLSSSGTLITHGSTTPTLSNASVLIDVTTEYSESDQPISLVNRPTRSSFSPKYDPDLIFTKSAIDVTNHITRFQVFALARRAYSLFIRSGQLLFNDSGVNPTSILVEVETYFNGNPRFPELSESWKEIFGASRPLFPFSDSTIDYTNYEGSTIVKAAPGTFDKAEVLYPYEVTGLAENVSNSSFPENLKRINGVISFQSKFYKVVNNILEWKEEGDYIPMTLRINYQVVYEGPDTGRLPQYAEPPGYYAVIKNIVVEDLGAGIPSGTEVLAYFLLNKSLPVLTSLPFSQTAGYGRIWPVIATISYNGMQSLSNINCVSGSRFLTQDLQGFGNYHTIYPPFAAGTTSDALAPPTAGTSIAYNTPPTFPLSYTIPNTFGPSTIAEENAVEGYWITKVYGDYKTPSGSDFGGGGTDGYARLTTRGYNQRPATIRMWYKVYGSDPIWFVEVTGRIDVIDPGYGWAVGQTVYALLDAPPGSNLQPAIPTDPNNINGTYYAIPLSSYDANQVDGTPGILVSMTVDSIGIRNHKLIPSDSNTINWNFNPPAGPFVVITNSDILAGQATSQSSQTFNIYVSPSSGTLTREDLTLQPETQVVVSFQDVSTSANYNTYQAVVYEPQYTIVTGKQSSEIISILDQTPWWNNEQLAEDLANTYFRIQGNRPYPRSVFSSSNDTGLLGPLIVYESSPVAGTSKLELSLYIPVAAGTSKKETVQIDPAQNDTPNISTVSWVTAIAPTVGESEENGENLQLSIPAGAIIDSSGSNPAVSFDWVYKKYEPTPTLSTIHSDVNNGLTSRRTVTVEVSCSAGIKTSTFDTSKILLTNATLSSTTITTVSRATGQSGVASAISFDVRADASGSVSVVLDSQAFQDAAGNSNSTSNTLSWQFNDSFPVIQSLIPRDGSGGIVREATDNTVVYITATFSLPVQTISLPSLVTSPSIAGKQSLSVSSVNSINSNPLTWNISTFLTAAPNTDGVDCSVTIPIGAFTDSFGVPNDVSYSVSWEFGNTPPRTVISSNVVKSGASTILTKIPIEITVQPYADPTHVTYTVDGDMTRVFDLDPSSVQVTDLVSVNSSKSTINQYTANIIPVRQNNLTQSIFVKPGISRSRYGVLNLQSNTFEWTFVIVPPVVTISSTGNSITAGIANTDLVPLQFLLNQVDTTFDLSTIRTAVSDPSGILVIESFAPIPNSSLSFSANAVLFPYTKELNPPLSQRSTSLAYPTNNNQSSAYSSYRDQWGTDPYSVELTEEDTSLDATSGPYGLNVALFGSTGEGYFYSNEINSSSTVWVAVDLGKIETIVGVKINGDVPISSDSFGLGRNIYILVSETRLDVGMIVEGEPMYLTNLVRSVETGFPSDARGNTVPFNARGSFQLNFYPTSGQWIYLLMRNSFADFGNNWKLSLKQFSIIAVDDAPLNGGSFDVFVDIPTNSFQDAEGTRNTTSSSLQWKYLIGPPNLNIQVLDAGGQTISSGGTIKQNTFSVVVTSSTRIRSVSTVSGSYLNVEYISGPVGVDLVSQPIIGSPTISSDRRFYTVDVTIDATVQGETTYRLSVPEGAVTSDLYLTSPATPAVQLNYENTPPTGELTLIGLSNGEITNRETVTFNLITDQAIRDFNIRAPFVDVTGPFAINVSSFRDACGNQIDVTSALNVGAGERWTFTGTVDSTITSQGTHPISVQLKPGALVNAIDLSNTAVIPTTPLAWIYDNSRPTALLSLYSPASLENDLTNQETLIFKIESNDVISRTTFDLSKVKQLTTGDYSTIPLRISTKTPPENASPDCYYISVTATPPGNDVTPNLLGIQIEEGAFEDSIGNKNTQSAPFSWTYNNTPPSVTLTAFLLDGTPLVDGTTITEPTITIIGTFDEKMDNVNESVITIAGNGKSIASFTSSDLSFNLQLDCERDGSYSAFVAAGAVLDQFGTANTASNTINWNYQRLPSTANLTCTQTNLLSGFETNQEILDFNVTFNQVIQHVTQIALDPSSGLNAYNVSMGADSKSLSFSIQTPFSASDQSYSIGLPQGACVDLQGTSSQASNVFSWVYSSARPVATFTSTTVQQGTISNKDNIPFVITFSEPLLSFSNDLILVSDPNLAYVNSSSLSADRRAYSFTLTIDTSSNVNQALTLSIAANSFQDAAGNYNDATSSFSWTYDNIPPTVTITTPHDDVNNGDSTRKTVSVIISSASGLVPSSFVPANVVASNAVVAGTATAVPGAAVVEGLPTAVSIAVTPIADGPVSVTIGAGAIANAIGNTNSTSNTINWTHINQFPVLDSFQLKNATGQLIGTNTSEKNITVDIVFSVAVSRIDKAKITFSVPQNDSSSIQGYSFNIPEVTGSGTTWSLTTNLLVNQTVKYFPITMTLGAESFFDVYNVGNTQVENINWVFGNETPSVVVRNSDSSVQSGSVIRSLTFPITITTGVAISPSIKEAFDNSGQSIFSFSPSSVTVTDLTTVEAGSDSSEAVFTAVANVSGDIADQSLTIVSDIGQSVFGISNSASNTLSWTFQQSPSVVTIEPVDPDSVTQDRTTLDIFPILFTISEKDTNFGIEDIVCTTDVSNARIVIEDFTNVSSPSSVNGAFQCNVRPIPKVTIIDPPMSQRSTSTAWPFNNDPTTDQYIAYLAANNSDPYAVQLTSDQTTGATGNGPYGTNVAFIDTTASSTLGFLAYTDPEQLDWIEIDLGSINKVVGVEVNGNVPNYGLGKRLSVLVSETRVPVASLTETNGKIQRQITTEVTESGKFVQYNHRGTFEILFPAVQGRYVYLLMKGAPYGVSDADYRIACKSLKVITQSVLDVSNDIIDSQIDVPQASFTNSTNVPNDSASYDFAFLLGPPTIQLSLSVKNGASLENGELIKESQLVATIDSNKNIASIPTIGSQLLGITPSGVVNISNISFTSGTRRITADLELPNSGPVPESYTIQILEGSLVSASGLGNVETPSFTISYLNEPPTGVLLPTNVSQLGTTNRERISFQLYSDQKLDHLNLGSNSVSIVGPFVIDQTSITDVGYDASGWQWTFNGNISPVTPNLQATIEVQLLANSLIDEVGLGNVVSIPTLPVKWNYTNVPPTITVSIFSPTLVAGVTSQEVIIIKVEASDAVNKSTIDLSKITQSTSAGFSTSPLSFAIVTPQNVETTQEVFFIQASIVTPPANNSLLKFGVSFGANLFTDEYGLANTDTATTEWTYSNVPPSVAISATYLENGITKTLVSSSPPEVIATDLVSFTISISEECTLLDRDAFILTHSGGRPSVISSFQPGPLGATGRVSSYQLSIQTLYDGTNSLSLPEGATQDAAGNSNTASPIINWQFTSTAPTCTLSSADVQNNGASNLEHLTFIATFDQSVSPISNLVLNPSSGLTAQSLTRLDDKRLQFVVEIPSSVSSKNYTIEIPANAVNNAQGTGNTASAFYNWTYSNVPPTASFFSPDLSNNGVTHFDFFNLTIIFSEPVYGFTLSDIVPSDPQLVSFPQGGSLSNDRKSFQLEVANTTSAIEVRRSVSITIPVGSFKDYIDNSNTQAFTFNWIYDTRTPTPVITASIAAGTKTNDSTIDLFVDTQFPSTDFTQSDLQFFSEGATTLPTITSFTKTSSTNYTVSLSTPTAGAFQAFIDRKKYKAIPSFGGNLNQRSNVFNWVFLGLPPKVTISSPSLVNVDGINYAYGLRTIVLQVRSDVYVNQFTLSSYDRSGVTLSNAQEQESGLQEVTATALSANELPVTVSIPVENIRGAYGVTALPPNPSITWIPVLRPDPTLSLVRPVYANVICSALPFKVKVTSLIPIEPNSFEISDIQASAGLTITDLQSGNENKEWVFTVAPPGDGSYLLSIPENVLTGTDGYGNRASNILSFIVFSDPYTPGIEEIIEARGLDPACTCRPLNCPPRITHPRFDTSTVKQLRGEEARRILMVRLAENVAGRTKPVVETQEINVFGSNAGAPSGTRGPIRNTFV